MARPKKKRKMSPTKQMALVLWGVMAPVCIYLGLHSGRCVQEENIGTGITNLTTHISENPIGLFPLTKYSFLFMALYLIIAGVAVLAFWAAEVRREHDKDANGTAGWNEDVKEFNKKYNTPFGKDFAGITPDYDNMIIGKVDNQPLMLSMNGSKTRRNAHQLVIGGSGAGKSFCLIKPNLLQMNCSFIVTDPKGELLEETGTILEENGYEVKVFNISEMEKSLTYNPYYYVETENDVRTMVKCIIDNTRGSDQPTGDPIWEDSMTELLQAVSFWMITCLPKEERNFSNAMRIIQMAEVDENKSEAKSDFDKIFDGLKADLENGDIINSEQNPTAEVSAHMALKSYKNFRIASGKTLKSILITCLTRLGVFNMPGVTALTQTDELHLEEMGERRQALFVIIPAADKTFNFLAATLYTQLFQNIYSRVEQKLPTTYQLKHGNDTFLVEKSEAECQRKAEVIKSAKENKSLDYIYNEKTKRWDVFADGEYIKDFLSEIAAKWWITNVQGEIVHGKRTLPYHTRFLLDEFANIGRIPQFVELLSTMRSYAVSCTIIMQDLAQLENLYDKNQGTIIANCDTFIYLGSQNKDVIEYVVTLLGKTQKTAMSYSLSHGKGSSNSESVQTVAADLLSFDQVREMPDNDCIVMVKGEKPFYAQKYALTEHPRYKDSGAGDNTKMYRIDFNNKKYIDASRDESVIAKKISEIGGNEGAEYKSVIQMDTADLLAKTLDKLATKTIIVDEEE